MTGTTAPRPARRARRTVLWGVLGIAVVVTGLAMVLPTGSAQEPESSPSPPATEPVVRETLVEQSTEKGSLGFGSPRTVSGAAEGTITWLPEPGSVIDRGDAVARVDDRPVVAVHGTMPLYRTLEPGIRGPDVRQLKDNLAALGYLGITDGDQFDRGTSRAVWAWQKALGTTQTGTVEPSAVVLLPGPVRVSAHRALLGGEGKGALLTVTGTEQVVTFELPAVSSHRVALDMQVGIDLPAGPQTTGTVVAVSPVQPPEGDDEKKDTDAEQAATKVLVTVRPDDPAALEGTDVTPVDVQLRTGERPDVLTVPVTALVALAGGGSAVEKVGGDGTTTLVPVTTGLSSGGRIEITPADEGTLDEADPVVVPT